MNQLLLLSKDSEMSRTDVRLSPTADAYGNAKAKMPLETYCSSMHQPPTEDAYEGSILRWRRETTQK